MSVETYRGYDISELVAGTGAVSAQNLAKALIDAATKVVTTTVTCTAALLDASTRAGKIEVAPAVAGYQYKIRNIILVGGGTNFGGAGDCLLDLTDGTTIYTTIANADLEAAPAASLPLGNAKVPLLTGTIDTATAAGAQLYFQYKAGSTTAHTTGSIKFIVTYERVAG